MDGATKMSGAVCSRVLRAGALAVVRAGAVLTTHLGLGCVTAAVRRIGV